MQVNLEHPTIELVDDKIIEFLERRVESLFEEEEEIVKGSGTTAAAAIVVLSL